MWSPGLTNDKHTMHETLPRPARLTFAFLEGLDRGNSWFIFSGVFQEKVEIRLCRATLVTEGVHRAPSL